MIGQLGFHGRRAHGCSMFETDPSRHRSCVEDFLQDHDLQSRARPIVPGAPWAAVPKQVAVVPHGGASDARAVSGYRGRAYGVRDRLGPLHPTHYHSFVFPRAIVVA